jgi:hypothetical protein
LWQSSAIFSPSCEDVSDMYAINAAATTDARP